MNIDSNAYKPYNFIANEDLKSCLLLIDTQNGSAGKFVNIVEKFDGQHILKLLLRYCPKMVNQKQHVHEDLAMFTHISCDLEL